MDWQISFKAFCNSNPTPTKAFYLHERNPAASDLEEKEMTDALTFQNILLHATITQIRYLFREIPCLNFQKVSFWYRILAPYNTSVYWPKMPSLVNAVLRVNAHFPCACSEMSDWMSPGKIIEKTLWVFVRLIIIHIGTLLKVGVANSQQLKRV